MPSVLSNATTRASPSAASAAKEAVDATPMSTATTADVVPLARYAPVQGVPRPSGLVSPARSMEEEALRLRLRLCT